MNLSHVEQLITVQEELLEVAKKKEIVLIENNLEELQRLVRLETKLISKTQVIQGALEIEQIDNEIRQPLVNKLTDVVSELQERNERNKTLLKDSLAFVKSSIQLLQPEKPVYTNEAKAKSGSQSLFDSRA